MEAENIYNMRKGKNMCTRFIVLFTLLISAFGHAQVMSVVDWSYSVDEISSKEFKLNITADIEDHWHLYALELDIPEGEVGPLPTELKIESLDAAKPIGEPTFEGEIIRENDPNFNMVLDYFEHSVTFSQTIEVLDDQSKIDGYLYFMVCDDKQCLAPEYVDFTFDPISKTLYKKQLVADPIQQNGSNPYHIESIDLSNPAGDCAVKAEETKGKGMMTIFLLGFIGGLLALLTPCVFPMIPLTVSYFTKGSQDKKKGRLNAIIYGLFILMIYLLLSVPFHLLDNISPDILNSISTNFWLNISFFVVFIVFAISFFGYFEITMPSSLANKADSASSGGGLLGIFFMSLTLAIVSFSCTGPILGSLLAGSLSSDGGAFLLTVGMAGFGLALALPFALFAMFPGVMSNLPSSGSWLNSVKVVLGFAEVALAFKFLSTADLVKHLGLVKYETFYIIWILCSLGIFLYLMGWIRFPHDSKLKKRGGLRTGLAVLFLGFAVYLSTGFAVSEETHTYIPKSLLSGLAPSPGYSYMYPTTCPQGLECYHSYEDGLAQSKATGKPMLIDFTGYGCVNCRKMEDNVWSKASIKNIIADEYILVSLYVDDKELLPEEEQMNYTMKNGATKKIRSIGDKWSTFQTETFDNNSQPWYCLVSPTEKLLTSPVGYTPNVDEYRQFLECGINNMKK